MRYGVLNHYGNHILAERAHCSGGVEHFLLGRISKAEAAGLFAAGVPFFTPPRPGDLPAADPVKPHIVFNAKRAAVDEPEWALMLGERRVCAINLVNAREMVEDGLATLDMTGHSNDEVRRQNLTIRRDDLLDKIRETQAELEAVEADLAALDASSPAPG